MSAEPTSPVPSADNTSALESVEALQPDVKATIAGRKLVFREYAVFEGYEIAYIAREFIAAMFQEAKAAPLKYTMVRRLIGRFPDVAIAIAAISADVDEAWVRALNRKDMDEFFAKWFVANAGFFVHEVLVEIQQALADKLTASNSTGSSSDSLAPASGTSTDSSDTPSDS